MDEYDILGDVREFLRGLEPGNIPVDDPDLTEPILIWTLTRRNDVQAFIQEWPKVRQWIIGIWLEGQIDNLRRSLL